MDLTGAPHRKGIPIRPARPERIDLAFTGPVIVYEDVIFDVSTRAGSRGKGVMAQ